MDAWGKVAAAAVVAVLVVGSLFGAYYLATSSALASQGQTISALQSTVSSLVSHTVTSTTVTSMVSRTTARFPYVPWNGGTTFVANTSDGCFGAGTCLTSDFTEAYVFTCTKAAASPQGCTVQINATKSMAFFQITVWYPFVNQTGQPSSAFAPKEFANCAFSNPREAVQNQFYAYCIPIGADAFIIALQPLDPRLRG